jgi:hypothetical protein
MGTQQILLIVLSVIIVGAAVAVGIQMFNTQSISSTRSAMLSDMNNFASMAMSYYRTPLNLGGAGNGQGDDGAAAWTAAKIAAYLGGTGSSVTTDNGTYTVTVSNTTVTFSGDDASGVLGDEDPDLDIDVSNGTITAYPTGKTA